MNKTGIIVRISRRRLIALFSIMILPALIGVTPSAAGNTSFSKEYLLEKYLALAFGPAVTRIPSGRLPELLSKRRIGAQINFFLMMGESVLATDAHIHGTVDAIDEVLETLAAHSAEFTYKFYLPDDVQALARLDAADQQKIFLDAVQIYVGSAHEIYEFTEKLAEAGVPIRDGYMAAKTGAEETGRPICFVGGSYQADDQNQVGTQVLYAEDNDRLDLCLYETIMRSLGLYSRLPSTESIFDVSAVRVPTDLDWQLWSLHLNRKLKHGMTIEEVKRIASEILK